MTTLDLWSIDWGGLAREKEGEARSPHSRGLVSLQPCL
jgi:hypothetical protein